MTGEIGAARRGFLARAAGQVSDWIAALREPVLPPIAAAGLLARHASAAMDVSDGLLGDARTLAEASGAGVAIDLDRVPFAGGVANLEESLDLATWGDDYQLLFTAAPSASDRIAEEAREIGLKVTRIGQIRAQPGLAVTSKGQFVNLPETVAFEHGRIGLPATRP